MGLGDKRMAPSSWAAADFAPSDGKGGLRACRALGEQHRACEAAMGRCKQLPKAADAGAPPGQGCCALGAMV